MGRCRSWFVREVMMMMMMIMKPVMALSVSLGAMLIHLSQVIHDAVLLPAITVMVVAMPSCEKSDNKSTARSDPTSRFPCTRQSASMYSNFSYLPSSSWSHAACSTIRVIVRYERDWWEASSYCSNPHKFSFV